MSTTTLSRRPLLSPLLLAGVLALAARATAGEAAPAPAAPGKAKPAPSAAPSGAPATKPSAEPSGAPAVKPSPAPPSAGPASKPDAESPPGESASAPNGKAPSGGDTTDSAAEPSSGEQCARAFERTQTERRAGHYLSATAAALECSQLTCNPAIVRECVRMYESLQEDTPTIVLAARKAEGGDLVDVHVVMDGKSVADTLTGRPFPVDPGPHVFIFTHAQRGQVKTTETARVGDHARIVEVTFTDPFAKPAEPASPLPVDRGPEKAGGIPVMTYVLGGVGAVALGSFVGFYLRASSDYNDYHKVCSPRCKPGDVDAIRREYVISYLSLGVGAASLAGAGVVYFVGRGREPAVEATVTPRGDGALASLRARF